MLIDTEGRYYTLSSDVLRLWLNSSVYENKRPFYLEGFKELGKKLGVEIELKTIPWSRLPDSYIGAFKNGSPPDVFQLGTTYIRTFAHLDYLAKVPSGFETKPSLSGWIDNCCTYKSSKVAIPWISDTMVMAVRQDILDRYGIKAEDVADWDGFYRICGLLAEEGKKIKNSGSRFFPMVFPIRPENRTMRCYLSWLLSCGWSFPAMTPIPACIFEDERAIKTFEQISRLIKVSGISIKDARLHPHHLFEQFITQGKYAFSIEYWGGDISGIVRHPEIPSINGENISIIPIPVSSGMTGVWGGGSTLGVSSSTKYPEAAWKLVEYLTSDSFMEQWTSNSGDLPAMESSFWERRSGDKLLDVMYNQIKRSVGNPSHPLWLRIERYMSEDIANLLWHMISSRTPDSQAGIRSVLQKIDRKVIDTLMMAWEMDNEE